jgi:hypothetical protein
MERDQVVCSKCGLEPTTPYDVGEGTIFCRGCGTILGSIGKGLPLWSPYKVVIPQKGVPQEVAEQFGGTRLNHEIALNAMDLKAQADVLIHEANNAKQAAMSMMDVLTELKEQLRKEQAETYRLREIMKDDDIHRSILERRIEHLERGVNGTD